LRFNAFEPKGTFDTVTNTIQTFIAMGGYAGFVWPAYALAAILLVGLWSSACASCAKVEAELAALGLDRSRERA